MSEMTIGKAASRTGLSTKTIRFYEEAGYIPRAERLASGYRSYTSVDVRRLKLVKLARLIGLPLAEAGTLVEAGFARECGEFAAELATVIEKQQALIEQRISELQALARDLDDLKSHVEHCECEPGSTVADCDYCQLLD